MNLLTHLDVDIARAKKDQGYRDHWRWRMQTDLLFLAHALGYELIEEETHREAIDVFVRKNPTRPFNLQTKKRRRILLLPRKTYKSTLSIVDSVQWVANFPDVAIMVMTASNSIDSPLADSFVAECASHFICAEPEACNHLFHICFPEHMVKKQARQGEYLSPARTRYRRDPTIKGVSIEQSLSGWHPDVLKGEDVQDNRNSQTAASLRRIRTNFYLNLKMLGESGLVDITGTRYGPLDLYGDMIARAGEETVLLWKPAYVRREHALKLEEDELTEGDVILQFPKQIGWQFLQEEKALDPDTWWTQYMNVAEGNFRSTFPMERLQSAKVSKDAHHHDDDSQVHCCWRMEYAECKNAAGAVGIERNGRITIVEVIQGQFTPTALARRMVTQAKKWNCHRIEIEDTPGARTMAVHVRNEAFEQEWHIQLSWSEFLQDETARALSIKSAEPHLIYQRLLFSDGMTNLQNVFRQLYGFGLMEEFEMASVVARIAQKLPASIVKDLEVTDSDAFQAHISQDAYERIYNRGRYYQPELVLPENEEVEWQAMQNQDLSEAMPGLSG